MPPGLLLRKAKELLGIQDQPAREQRTRTPLDAEEEFFHEASECSEQDDQHNEDFLSNE
jgi:hypothetical protein